MSENGIKTYEVPVLNFGTLEYRIDQLNRRAEKLGLSGVITITVLEEKTVKRQLDPLSTFKTPVRVKIVTIEGERVRLPGGWYFVGVIEHGKEANILRPAPGEEIPAKYRTVEPYCEHCKLNRQRKDTYIVANDDGDHLQVGKTCLKDFVGHRSPEAIAGALQALALFKESLDDPDFLGGGHFKAEGYGPITFLTFVAASIRIWGWTPKSKADFGRPATVETAEGWIEDTRGSGLPNNQIRSKHGGAETFKGQTIETTDEDVELAKAALDWAADELGEKAQNGTLKSDYLWNLWVAASEAREVEIVKFRRLGILASAISAYQRDYAKKIERADSTSEWVGKEGKRQEFTGLTVVDVKGWNTDWGYQELYRLQDPDGNILIWKTTSGSLEQGDTYYGKATVKKDGKGHTTYKGEKQTVITRPAFHRLCCDNPKPTKSNHPSVAEHFAHVTWGWVWVCKNCLEGI